MDKQTTSEFEPVLDAEGGVVDLSDLDLDPAMLDFARRRYASMVPAPECDHYMSKSERDAGFTTCEHCIEWR